jgi:hypothetical protein
VIDVAQHDQAKIILQEPWFPDATTALVAKKSGARLIVVPGSPDYRNGQSYTGFIDAVVKKLEAGLR